MISFSIQMASADERLDRRFRCHRGSTNEQTQGSDSARPLSLPFKSKTNATECIISAHGGFLFTTVSFTVPKGAELRFFSPHSSLLIDPGLEEFHAHLAKAIPTELAKGKSCRDYLLQKYQGRHNEVGETYNAILESVMEHDQGGGGASVVTVRNRWDLVAGIRLSDVIAAVRREVPTISRFYCLFCRANVVSDSLAKAFNMVYGQQIGGLMGTIWGVKQDPSVAIGYNA